MEHPARQNPAATPAPPADDIPSYLLSREYEDHLDWLENQRNSRNKGARRGRAWLGPLSGFAGFALALAGTMMRKR